MHGAVWHAMLQSTNRTSTAGKYWRVAEELCDFSNSFAAISWSCFHGSGHAMLLSGMHDHVRRLACSSPSHSLYPLNVSDLARPISLCSAGPTEQHAFLCADGLFDQFFQLSVLPSDDDLWPGPCARFSLFSGPCFNNYLGGIKLYWPANKMRIGYLAFQTLAPDCSVEMDTELRNRGCIFGLSRNQFTFWWWGQQNTLPARAALVTWCKLVIDSVALSSTIRYGRLQTCISSCIFGFNFALGLSKESNLIIEDMCRGVREMSGNESTTLCLQVGLAMVMSTSLEAVSVLPPWFAS